MIQTEDLFNIAEQEGIAVEWHDFEGINGVYISGTKLSSPIIGLNKTLEYSEKNLRCTLAHELGHHYRTAGQHVVFASFKHDVSYSKAEALADRWAIEKLMPTKEFLEKLSTGMDILSLADYFWVTEEFIHKRYKSLQVVSLV